jgi:hypothetical protein
VCAIEAVVKFPLSIRAVRCDADVGVTAKAAFDKAAQQIFVACTALAEQKVRPQCLLRLLPDFVADDRGDGT